MYFNYGSKETEYLKKRDQKLGKIIDKFGHIEYETDENLLSAVVYIIIGQQISTKAQNAIWKRVKECLTDINADSIIALGINGLRSQGVSGRKAEYIIACAKKIKSGDIAASDIKKMSDEEAVKELTKLKGVGIWTAEILLLFCFMRENILSYDDLGIQNGLRAIYHHKIITRELFEKYRKKFSPYCSIASIYLWAAADNI